MARSSYTKREPITSLEDLRDDCVAVVLNSGQSFKRVHEKGGPTPQTTSKWLYRETRFPQLATIRAMLNACDYDLTIAHKGSPRIERLNADGAVKMPPKPKRTAARSNRLRSKSSKIGPMIAGRGRKATRSK